MSDSFGRIVDLSVLMLLGAIIPIVTVMWMHSWTLDRMAFSFVEDFKTKVEISECISAQDIDELTVHLRECGSEYGAEMEVKTTIYLQEAGELCQVSACRGTRDILEIIRKDGEFRLFEDDTFSVRLKKG